MKKRLTLIFVMCVFNMLLYSQTIYTDSHGDIDPGIANGGGTLDILSMEVSHTSTDFIFKLTVNGNISTTDWGKFMIGIATGNTAGTATGNGWGRPINLDATGAADMNYWIGSWIDGGGGSQLWSYNNGTSSWAGPGALAGFSFVAGPISTITYTVSHASLGISAEPGSLHFDAYSSGGGGTDSAVDALANPNVSITSWDQNYTSNAATGLLLYSWTVLPVELTSFTATNEKDEVLLLWETATELNNYGFEIQRSSVTVGQTISLSTWEKIGFVAGHGNSNSTKDYSFTDNNIPTSGKYAYRLKQIDTDGSFSYSQVVETDVTVNLTYSLGQNYPNPFNPLTTINYSIPVDANVQLYIFTIMGELVQTLVNEQQTAGSYSVNFDARQFASGTYIYRLVANDFVQTKKMVLLK